MRLAGPGPRGKRIGLIAGLVSVGLVAGLVGAWAAGGLGPGSEEEPKPVAVLDSLVKPVPSSTPAPSPSTKTQPEPGSVAGQEGVAAAAVSDEPDQGEAEPEPTEPESTEPESTATPSADPEPAEPVVSAPVQLRNRVTGLCADLPGTGPAPSGRRVGQGKCVPGDADNQMFELVRLGDAFAIRNVKSGTCLNVVGAGSVQPQEGVGANPCVIGGNENMMFRKVKQDGGSFLKHVKSGLCLDVSNSKASWNRPDRKLTLYPCDPQDDHIWQIRAAG